MYQTVTFSPAGVIIAACCLVSYTVLGYLLSVPDYTFWGKKVTFALLRYKHVKVRTNELTNQQQILLCIEL